MDSAAHRIAKRLEERMYSRADGIIAMSRRGKECIEALNEVRRKGTPVIVVPSCVDLEHFQFQQAEPPVEGEPLRLVYSGSVGGRDHLDRVARFVAVAADHTRRARELSLLRDPIARWSSLCCAPADWMKAPVNRGFAILPNAGRISEATRRGAFFGEGNK